MSIVDNDVKVCAATCQAIVQLKKAREIAVAVNPRFTALEREIELLEEWVSLWSSESGDSGEEENDPTLIACQKVMDNYKIEHRPYA